MGAIGQVAGGSSVVPTDGGPWVRMLAPAHRTGALALSRSPQNRIPLAPPGLSGNSFALSHTYAQEGGYDLQVWITNETGTGSFADPSKDTWTATVDYGDGGGPTSLTLADHNFSLSHVYSHPGVYTISVVVRDDQGLGGEGRVSVTVGP